MKRTLGVIATVLGLTSCLNPADQGPPLTAALSQASLATWTPIASMANARYASMAAGGLDGRIYVFGGLNTATYDPPSEVYDPAADTWGTIAQSDRRFLAGVARGGDGRIYLAGGTNFAGDLSSVISYDPSANSYAAAASLSVARQGPAAAAGTDGKVYVIGGYNNSGVLTSGEVYDPSAGTWSPIAPTAVAHYAGAAAAASDGRIFVFGGLDASFGPSGTVEAYDPTADTWTTVATLPPRYGHAALAGTDGLIYVIGGQDDAGEQLSSAVAFDPASNAWTNAPSLNSVRYMLAAATGSDGRLYAIGGRAGFDILSTAEYYQTEGAAPVNQAPTANAGGDVFAECVGAGANVTLDGSASSDPDDGIVSYEWLENGTVVATEVHPTLHLPMGSTTLTLRVTDAGGLSATDDVVVTVEDTQPPAVSLSLLASQVWPPNHTMRLVAEGIAATDACDPTPALTISVTSNEPVTSADWEVVRREDGTFAVWVRAERDGSGSGRVYTITATATDHTGNLGTAVATVSVPH